MTKEELKTINVQFVYSALVTLDEIRLTAKQKCKEVLKLLGGRVSWDWQEEDAPSLISINFGNKLADCYIKSAYFDENDNIKVDLHAYYLDCDDYDGVLLSREPHADYIDLLEYLNEQL